MATLCDICSKTSTLVTIRRKLRGKYNPTTKKRRYPNLQKTLIDGKQVVACTHCIRTAAKTK